MLGNTAPVSVVTTRKGRIGIVFGYPDVLSNDAVVPVGTNHDPRAFLRISAVSSGPTESR